MAKARHRPARVIAGSVTLVLTLLLLQITTAPMAAAASISISPSSGLAGSSARVTGGDFLPLLAVDLCWGGSGCSNLGTTVADIEGNFGVAITVPTDATAGRYTVSACQSGLGCSETVFDVTSDDTTTSSTSSTTIPGTTTLTLGSTTTLRTTTSMSGPASGTPPSTTSTPGPTTVPTTATTTTTSTTISDSTTTSDNTGEGAVAQVGESTPPTDGSTASTFVLGTLTGGTTLYSIPDPTTPEDPAALGVDPLLAAAPAEDGESSFSLDDVLASGDSPIAFSGFGIWLGWLLLIVVAFAGVMAIDEGRRRREN